MKRNKTENYDRSVTMNNHAESAEHTSNYKSYYRGGPNGISYETYSANSNAISIRYAKANSRLAVNQELAWDAKYVQYHLQMQKSGQAFSLAVVKYYETYEKTLADGLSEYLIDSINAGVDVQSSYSSSLDSLIDSFELYSKVVYGLKS
jgi:hypothetical protein